MSLRRVPPGRAGRLWLQHRLDVARRGADLLDRKLRILHTEGRRLALHESRTARAWEDACREADTWLLRSALLGGERALRLAADARPALVDVAWTVSMGVRYPGDVTCRVPAPAPEAPPVGTAALVPARQAYARAVEAAAAHAAAQAAVRVLAAEEAATRRRLRAIEDRWVPRLQAALSELRLGLEEEEHAEGVRLRWAAARVPGAASGRPGEGER